MLIRQLTRPAVGDVGDAGVIEGELRQWCSLLRPRDG